MLQKPDVPDDRIVDSLERDFGLAIVTFAFMPVGADVNSAAYRAVTVDGAAYFVKLRRNVFKEPSVTVPKLLSDCGVANVIPPLPTQDGRLWAKVEGGTLILYPFVSGDNGYSCEFTAQHWIELGGALAHLHGLVLPDRIASQIPHETYSPQWRNDVLSHLGTASETVSSDPITAELSAFLHGKRSEIVDLVERTEMLATVLRRHAPQHVVCHSDLHAGNVLIDGHSRLYIIDWDDPILAPKERDLMFVGGGQGFRGRTREEEISCFLQGYGATEVDQDVIAYYQFERIIQDIATFGDEIYGTEGLREDRVQALRYLKANFNAGGTLEVAHANEKDCYWNRGIA